jgi:hypothetical protein
MMNLNIPGVPALAQKFAPALNAIGTVSQIGNAIAQLTGMGITPVWGVYDQDGNDALQADSIAGFDYRNGSRLVDYPVEDGGFQSYNKVANPFEAPVMAACGGSIEARQAFQQRVETMLASLDTYTLVTPEKVYPSVNLERIDFSRRNNQGASLLVFNLWFREIRVTASINGQAPKLADAVPVRSLGQVAPNPINTALSGAMSGAAQQLAAVKGMISNTATSTIHALNDIRSTATAKAANLIGIF